MTRLAFLPLCLALLLVGCADGFVADPPSSVDGTETTSKLRHAALMAAAPRISSTALGSADKDGADYVGLIVSLDPYRVVERYGEMDPFRVFDRYRTVERYRIVDRYEYEHVFPGAAIWVDEDDLDDLLDDLEDDDAVTWAEPDAEMSLDALGLTAHSDGQSETTPWSVLQIGAGTGSAPNVDLYVADTGISSGDIDERGWRDFSRDKDGPNRGRDRNGHGTHIAGIAAAGSNGSGIRGIAAGAKVYDLRVLTGDEEQDDSPVDLASAIAAVEHATAAKLAAPARPAVLNFSLGTDVGTSAYNALDDAVEAAVSAGVVVVVAAGNSGTDVSTISPAHAASAITVGAHDQNGAFASFSNYGAGIDLLAPGVDILSSHTDAGADGADVAMMSGTSMAAGHVSGAAALFLEANPQATPAQVTAALLASARTTATGVPSGTTTRTLWVGEGGALDIEVPPFFDYAVYAGGKAELKGTARVTTADGNASLFATELKTDDEESHVDGFGYYTEKVEGRPRQVFRPRVNPTGLAPVQQVQPLAFDASQVSVAALAPRATRVTDGDLELAGQVQLGTAEAPVVWLVRGKLKIDADVTVSGYGVFLVEDNAEFKKDVHATAGSALAVFSGDEIRVDADHVRLNATLFSVKKAEVKDGARITGSLTSLDDVVLDGDVVVHKVPLAPALARALWD